MRVFCLNVCVFVRMVVVSMSSAEKAEAGKNLQISHLSTVPHISVSRGGYIQLAMIEVVRWNRQS